MTMMGRALSIFFGSIVLLMLSQCVVGNSGDEAKLQTIDFQLRWRHQFQFAGYYAAIEQGYYRDEGLDVRLHEAAPGKTPVAELLAGRVQYAESNSDILFARLQGEPVVVLVAIFQHSPSVLLVKQEGNIHTPHDLIGKKVMLLNPQTDAYFQAMLLSEGVNLSDVGIVPSSLDINDLIEGKVDAFNAYITNEPFILKQRGVDYGVINPASYGIDFYSDILFTTEQEVKEHPKRVQAFLRASLKGWCYAMAHPDEIIELLLTKYMLSKSREHLQYEAAAMRSLVLPDIVEIGHMNPGRWRRMAKFYIDLGLSGEEFSLDEFVYRTDAPNQIVKLRKILTVVSTGGVILLIAMLILIWGWLRLRREIELRKEAEAQARRLAYNDPLTGIANRNSFISYAEKQLQLALRNEQKFALCFIDLNEFKAINDRYGHKAGDAILIHVAKAIVSVIRGSDMTARYGGDEFVVLLAGVQGMDDTNRVVREIQRVIASQLDFNGALLSITASIGAAVFPDDGVQVDELISKADQAMFKEKAKMKGVQAR